MRQHFRHIPLDFAEWDWHDKRYFEWWACRHQNAYYRERRNMDLSGFDNWDEVKEI